MTTSDGRRAGCFQLIRRLSDFLEPPPDFLGVCKQMAPRLRNPESDFEPQESRGGEGDPPRRKARGIQAARRELETMGLASRLSEGAVGGTVRAARQLKQTLALPNCKLFVSAEIEKWLADGGATREFSWPGACGRLLTVQRVPIGAMRGAWWLACAHDDCDPRSHRDRRRQRRQAKGETEELARGWARRRGAGGGDGDGDED